jgi:hypothetical protein
MISRLFRLSDKQIGRRLSDKQIGRRFYIIESDNWNAYNNKLNIGKNKQTTYYNVTDAMSNTISIQTQEIKHLKMEILTLHSRINNLTIIIDKNHNYIKTKFLNLSRDM